MKTKWIFRLLLLCAVFGGGLGVSQAQATQMDLFDIYLYSGTDADGDGYYEEFTIEIDADMLDGSTGTAYAVITDNTGDVSYTWNITGSLTSDNAFVTMYDYYYALSSPTTVNVTVYLYDNSTGEYVDGLYLNVPIDGGGSSCASAYPYLYDAALVGGVDADGDGYYETFDVEIDGDVSSSSCSSSVYAVITDNTGNVVTGSWTITGSQTSDNVQVTMPDDYYNLSSPQTVTVTVTLYDSNGASAGSTSFYVPVDNGSTSGCSSAYPYFYDVWLNAVVDADGDGYYEEFEIGYDVDSTSSGCSHDISVVVSDNTGNTSFGPDTISGFAASDALGATMYDEWYNLSSPAVQSVTVDLYDNTSGAWMDSETLSIPVDSTENCATPYLWGAGIDSYTDTNSNGYYEEFNVWIDADTSSSSCPAQVYAEITDNTGNVIAGPWSVAGGTSGDTTITTMYDEWYGLSSSQSVSVTVTLYDNANGAAIGYDTFTVPVEGAASTGSPFVYDLWLNDSVDADSDGYYEEFQFGIDVDCATQSCSADVYSVVSASLGDVTFETHTVNGWSTNDLYGLTMDHSDYGLSVPATVNVTVTTFDVATGAVIDASTFAIPIDSSSACSMYLFDAWQVGGVDADGDGYYEEFDIEIDADMTDGCSGSAYAVVTDNTGNAGFGPWSISGTATTDNAQVTIYDEWYDLSSPSTVNVSVYIYDYDSGAESGNITFAVPVDSAAFTGASWPMNDTEFVQQVYRDFLNREAESGGLSYWVSQLNAGLSREQVVEEYLLSAEFQGNIAPVARLYFAYFNRIPDYSGLMYWVTQFGNGAPLTTVSDAFSGSTEFVSTYGNLSNQAFVNLVYQNVLGRGADAAGLSYWTGQLNSGSISRGEVMTGFSESSEYKNIMSNQIYVTMTYIGLLRRAPEQGGFNYWVNAMNGGASGLVLIDGFLISPEYAARF